MKYLYWSFLSQSPYFALVNFLISYILYKKSYISIGVEKLNLIQMYKLYKCMKKKRVEKQAPEHTCTVLFLPKAPNYKI